MSKPPFVQYQIVDNEGSFVEELLASCLNKWGWFLMAIILFGAGAYGYLTYKQPVYQIRASLMIKENQAGQESSNALKEIPNLTSNKVVENEIVVLHSSPLMNQVVKKLKLNIHYLRPTKLGEWEIYDESPIVVNVDSNTPTLYKETLTVSLSDHNTLHINGKAYPFNQKIQVNGNILQIKLKRPVEANERSISVRFTPVVVETANLLKILKVESEGKNSSIINLSLEDPIPERGEAILTQLVTEYKQAGLMDKNDLALNTLNFIDQRLKGVSNDITKVEAEVETYKTRQGITDLSTQSKTLLESIQSNDVQLSQVTIQLASLGELESYLNSRVGKRGTTPATFGLQDQILTGLIEKLIGLEQERDQLARLTAEQNILVSDLDNQIKATKDNIRSNVQTMRSFLNSSQLKLQNRTIELETQIRAIPQKERQLMDITRRQTIKNELYTYLLRKKEETAVSFAINLPASQVIEPAIRSANPIKPVKGLVYGISMLLALLLPTTIIGSQKLVHKRIGRRQDVEEQTIVPILGEVARQPKRKGTIISGEEFSVTAEQIRILRSKLLKVKKGKSRNLVVLTTSSISGEGKSFVSLNVGVSMASAGLPTVLVELDLRNPKIHSILNIKNNVGISNYLKGECTIDDVLQPVVGHPCLSVLPCGTFDSSPAELLCNPRIEQMFNELRERYAFVILDTPPVGIVSDAYQLAPYADTTLFIVRHNVTPKKCISILNSLNEENQFPELLIVLNGVTEGSPYNINYSYQSNYGHNNKNTLKRFEN